MKIVTHPPTARKAFYSFLYDEHGILTQDDAGAVWFRNSETDALTLITPEMYGWIQTLGEVGMCETQRLADIRHGGAAMIACSRDEGRC